MTKKYSPIKVFRNTIIGTGLAVLGMAVLGKISNSGLIDSLISKLKLPCAQISFANVKYILTEVFTIWMKGFVIGSSMITFYSMIHLIIQCIHNKLVNLYENARYSDKYHQMQFFFIFGLRSLKKWFKTRWIDAKSIARLSFIAPYTDFKSDLSLLLKSAKNKKRWQNNNIAIFCAELGIEYSEMYYYNNRSNITKHSMNNVICPLCKVENEIDLEKDRIYGIEQKCFLCCDSEIEIIFRTCRHAISCRKCIEPLKKSRNRL